ncbi:MAG: GAF domain-containing protein [Cyclobacteriaceae bacterium]
MYIKGKKIPFPAITQVSFFKVLESLEKLSLDEDPTIADFAKVLLADSEKFPELKEGIGSEDFDPNQEIIQRLCRTLFPDVLLTNEIKGIMPPFEFKPFYYSTRFKNIFEASEKDLSFELNDYTEDQLYIFGCIAILGGYYKYAFPAGTPTLVDIPNKKLNVVKTYRMAMNGDLMYTIPTDKAVDITLEDYLELLDNFDNIELWKKKFPPNSWIMRGIAVANLMDVTVDNALSTITSNLLSGSVDAQQNILNGVRNLFGIRELEIGLLEYENDSFLSHEKESMGSILLKDRKQLLCNGNLCKYCYDLLIDQRKPLIISDVERFDTISQSEVSGMLKSRNIKSYIVAPISHENEFLGFLELGSPRKYDLNGASLEKLEAVMPILGVAISRFKREDQNRREAIIQQECTTIHPSVKWRFEEEANKFMEGQSEGERPVFSDIIFRNVFPIYGQLDIRGSSEKRNLAVRDDLVEQLNLTKNVLQSALQKTKMPIYEQLLTRVEEFLHELDDELHSGSETRIIGFLETEIHPVLDQLKKKDATVGLLVDDYKKRLHPESNSIYNQRKRYDQSVNTINQTLASLLDEKQIDAQRMFPHYFERYKTDGVEYNIYVGQSISKNQEFEPVYLQNLQLWQLMTTCELEQKFVELKKDLQSDIEIASLILVYNSPLAVHFRMDEKRFDVEGAYNARYEIVKKRIDKARIKGTNERITVPGKIAIIYSSEYDEITYRKYIKYLEDKGYLKKNSSEVVDVESLQGITGLKALRVDINYGDSLLQSAFDVDKILERIEKN